ncbi:MAG: M3 family metallopeptidase [Nanoarchaeota archaeon]|nr:M3 family metallopeptidase [Nanoarchaeota archaeon]
MQLTSDNHDEFKEWAFNTVEDIKKLEGVELIEKSEEFFADYYDQYAELQVKHTQRTNDEIVDKELSFMRDEINPVLAEAGAKIAEKVIKRDDYPAQFKEYVKSARVTHELFHPDIPELQKRAARLETDYEKKYGSLTIEVNGEKFPVTKAGKLLESFDKDIRKEAWNSLKKAFVENQEFFEKNYIELVNLRKKIAEKAGCKDYIEYIFKAKLREYTPQDCYDYHEAVKKYVVPRINEFQKKRKSILNVERLYPYDCGFSINAKHELHPFDPKDEKKFVSGIKNAINKISPDIAKHFQEMYDNKRFDLIARENKAPGGYNMPFVTKPYSFIFMNANGTHRDLNTLCHEEGHAWHGGLTMKYKYPFEKDYSAEVAETASTFLEHVSSEKLNDFYSDEELRWALKDQWASEIGLLSWVATIDKFQHEVFKTDVLDNEKLREIWKSVSKEFRGEVVDWENDLDFEQIKYAQQLHPFTHPFYYIEYAICFIASAQLMKIFSENPKEALERYNKGLSLGGTVSTKEVYETGFGIPLKFGEEQVKLAVELYEKKLKELE